MVPNINPADQAPRVKTGHTPRGSLFICSYIAKPSKIFSETMRPNINSMVNFRPTRRPSGQSHGHKNFVIFCDALDKMFLISPKTIDEFS